MKQENEPVKVKLRVLVRSYQADAQELIESKRQFEAAEADQQRDQLQQLETKIREANDRLHDSYQTILQILKPQLDSKARQARILGDSRDFFDEVLANCLSKVDPDTEGLHAYILRSCTNEITNHFRRRKKRISLPWSMASSDGDDEAESPPTRQSSTPEPVAEPDAPTTDEERLKVYDPEAYRSQQVARLVAEYAVRKRMLIDGLKFSSPARGATLLTDQRQKAAKLLSQSGYSRDEIPTQTEQRERWSDEDPHRDLKRGTPTPSAEGNPTLAEVWGVISERIRNSQQHIGEQMVVGAIRDCGWAVSRETWAQRRRRYREELSSQLDPHDLKYFA